MYLTIVEVRVSVVDTGERPTMVRAMLGLDEGLIIANQLLAGDTNHRRLAVELQNLVDSGAFFFYGFVRVY